MIFFSSFLVYLSFSWQANAAAPPCISRQRSCRVSTRSSSTPWEKRKTRRYRSCGWEWNKTIGQTAMKLSSDIHVRMNWKHLGNLSNFILHQNSDLGRKTYVLRFKQDGWKSFYQGVFCQHPDEDRKCLVNNALRNALRVVWHDCLAQIVEPVECSGKSS